MAIVVLSYKKEKRSCCTLKLKYKKRLLWPNVFTFAQIAVRSFVLEYDSYVIVIGRLRTVIIELHISWMFLKNFKDLKHYTRI